MSRMTPPPPIPSVNTIDQVITSIQDIADGLVVVRDAAWVFAKVLACEPSFVHPASIMVHDLEVAKLGSLILHPPKMLQDLVTTIAAAESRDIAHNIQVLDAAANNPAPITKTAAAKI
jgi:hypothetical protein